MKRTILLLVALLPLLTVTGQKKNKKLEKIGNSITTADPEKHLYTVASAEMEGRDTPSPGLEKAITYIEKQFKSPGLQPGNGAGYRLSYPLYCDTISSSSLKVNDKTFTLNNDYQNNKGNHAAELPFPEAAFAGYSIVDGKINNYKDLDVRGKATNLLEGAPGGYKPLQPEYQDPAGKSGKSDAAANNDDLAVLMILKNFRTRPSIIQSNWG